MEKTLLCLSLAAISAGLIAFKPANASAKAADNALVLVGIVGPEAQSASRPLV